MKFFLESKNQRVLVDSYQDRAKQVWPCDIWEKYPNAGPITFRQVGEPTGMPGERWTNVDGVSFFRAENL